MVIALLPGLENFRVSSRKLREAKRGGEAHMKYVLPEYKTISLTQCSQVQTCIHTVIQQDASYRRSLQHSLLRPVRRVRLVPGYQKNDHISEYRADPTGYSHCIDIGVSLMRLE